LAVEARRRYGLPQLGGAGLFVTDGGLETELIFHNGLDLPCFAAFPLLDNPDTRIGLRRYYDRYLAIARENGAGFIIETPTWRANPDWAGQLGYSAEQLDAVNRDAVALAEEVRSVAAADGITAVVSGCLGPRGDGYDPDSVMRPDEAERYHAMQAFPRRSRSRSKPTAGYPRASRCMRRSSRWTPRPTRLQRISWSTAPTQPTSPRR
jgi:S-methylmethionine-dependent homocysteine/selenocysteine methylase